jgi:hypothetical protein
MAGKKFSTKGLRLRSRAAVRRRDLKVNPVPKGIKTSIEQANLDIIRSIEEKVNAVQD